MVIMQKKHLDLHSTTGIIVLALVGFLISCLLAWPFHLHWDAAYIFSRIYNSGRVDLSVWQGWYFPLLWNGFYRMTGCPLAIGFWIIALYWTGITILYLAIFDARRTALWVYMSFAWFPGTLLFLFSVTNNALFFTMLLLGGALIAWHWRKKRNWWIFSIGVFCLLQCLFIRRETLLFLIPFLMIVAYTETQRCFRRIYAIALAIMITLVSSGALLSIERICTSSINGYHSFDSLSYTVLYDLTYMSHYKGKLLLPDECLKPEFRDERLKPKVLEKLSCVPEIKTSCVSDYDLRVFWEQVLEDPVAAHAKFTVRRFLPIYLHNIRYYIQHRLRYISTLCYTRQRWLSTIKYKEDFGAFVPPEGSKTVYALTTFWTYSPPACVYYFLGFALLILVGKDKKISHEERLFLSVLLILCMLVSMAVMLLAISAQVRYIAPYLLLIYYMSLYLIDKHARRKDECNAVQL